MPSTRTLRDLAPSDDLLSVFEDCHNAIYANDGLLKDRIFNEITKLLVIKLTDEQRDQDEEPLFVPGNGSPDPRFRELVELTYAKHPNLIAGPDDLSLSPGSMNYVISRLAGISLSKSPGDVKGQAFQTFVYRNQRGDRGEFFTPHPVVRLAVAMIDPAPDELVLDPACGSGGFLIEALAHWVKRGLAGDPSSYIAHRLRGWEFNPEVARAAAVRLEFEGGSGDEIAVRNSLLEPDAFANQFDVVLTNPPFGSKGRVDDASLLAQYDLGHRWRFDGATWTRVDALLPQTPEILFLELCVRVLRPGGRLAVVLPDGLLQNSSAGQVRHWLRQHCDITAVISYPSETFVPYGTGIKTSLLLAQKRGAHADTRPRFVFMSRVGSVGYDSKGRPRLRRPDDCPQIERAWRAYTAEPKAVRDAELAFTTPTPELRSRLDVEHYLPDDRDLVAELQNAGARPLRELATVVRERVNLKPLGTEPIRYVAISNIDTKTMRIVSHDLLPADEAPSRATYEIRAGDLLTAVSGASTGTASHAVAFVAEEDAGAISSNGLAVIRDVRGVDPLYLLAFMRSPTFLRQVRRLRTGHAIPAISLEDLQSVLVPIPPPQEQEEVAALIRQMFRLRDEATALGRRTVDLLG